MVSPITTKASRTAHRALITALLLSISINLTSLADTDQNSWLRSAHPRITKVIPGGLADDYQLKANDLILGPHEQMNLSTEDLLALLAFQPLPNGIPIRIRNTQGERTVPFVALSGGLEFGPDWSPTGQAMIDRLQSQWLEGPLENTLHQFSDGFPAGDPSYLPLVLLRASIHDSIAAEAFNKARDLAQLMDHWAHGPYQTYWHYLAAFQHGQAAFRLGQLPEARDRFEAAMTLAEQATNHWPQIRPRSSLTGLLAMSGQLNEALDGFARNLEQARQRRPCSHEEAVILNAQGTIAYLTGSFDRAGHSYRQALAILEQTQPDSSNLATLLQNLGAVHRRRGDFVASQHALQTALEWAQRIEPEGEIMIGALNNLGTLAWSRERLSEAQQWFQRCLAILEKGAGQDEDRARIEANLGSIAMIQGDLRLAYQHFQNSRGLRESLDPQSLAMASALQNLGHLSRSLGRWSLAQRHLERALAIRQNQIPNAPETADTLAALGDLARDLGRFDEAIHLHEQAHTLRVDRDPTSAAVAASLSALAHLEFQRHHLEQAHAHHLAAIALKQKQTTDGFGQASDEYGLGRIAAQRGKAQQAENHFQAAIERHRRHGLLTLSMAKMLLAASRNAMILGKNDQALALAREAARIAEDQGRNLTGDLDRPHFSSIIMPIFSHLINLELELGETTAAWNSLERSRAQGMIAWLRQAPELWRSALPPNLSDRLALIANHQNEVMAELDQMQGDQEQELMSRWSELALEYQHLLGQVQTHAPRLAAALAETNLDFDEFSANLLPGTLVLAFSFHETGGWVLTLQSGLHPSMSAARLTLDGRQLEQEVWLLHQLLTTPLSSQEHQNTWQRKAARLFDQLLGPVSQQIQQAERLWIIPDGAMHTLPLAVLAAAKERRLPPITNMPSLTLNQHLKPTRPNPTTPFWVGIGNPDYPTITPSSNPGQRTFQPLPGSQLEMSLLAKLIGSQAQTFTGTAATEALLKDGRGRGRIVHLACHGIYDHGQPLFSALALTPEQPHGDGLLHAWEVMRDVRLSSELVVLSGCGTGQGVVMGGEGVVGMSRAFFWTGTSSLLASLWPIDDAFTAEFMRHFYLALLRGADKAEALRTAQQTYRDHPTYGHPYYWGAFQLIGNPAALENPPHPNEPFSSQWWRIPCAMALAVLVLVLVWPRRPQRVYPLAPES